MIATNFFFLWVLVRWVGLDSIFRDWDGWIVSTGLLRSFVQFKLRIYERGVLKEVYWVMGDVVLPAKIEKGVVMVGKKTTGFHA